MNKLGYMEQYKRMNRWFSRFEEIYNNRDCSSDPEHRQDEVYAFFVSCYHLKDWIKNDEKINIDAGIIESFVEKNENLKICGDICNSFKHLKLNNPRIGSGANMDEEYPSPSFGPEGPVEKIKYNIVEGDKIFDAFSVASGAVELWKNFLCKNDKNFKSNL